MDILLLANKVPYPPTDGGAYATLNMALGLSNAGAKVTLLAMSTPKHPSSSTDFPDEILKKISVHTVFVDTNISLLKAMVNLLFSPLAYNAQRFISSEYRIKLASLLQSNKFDIIQIEGLFLEPYINTIKQYHKGIIAFRAHNVEWEIWKRNAQIQKIWIKRWYFNLLSKRIMNQERRMLSNIDTLVPISKRDGRMLISLAYSGSMHVTPTGFNFDTPDEFCKSFEFPSVFHLGGLDWIPNQEGIIWFLENCWIKILSEIPNVKFYIAGRNAPDSFVRKLKSYPNVIFCGEVDNSATFIKSKGLMVVPLLSGSGMRIKIVEGMSLGKAILTTRIGVEGIDAIDGEHIAIADTPDQFAQRAIELLKSNDKTLEMGHNAMLFAETNLNNDFITSGLVDFYSQLISQ